MIAGGGGGLGEEKGGKESRAIVFLLPIVWKENKTENLFLLPLPESPPFMPYACNLVVVWQTSTVHVFLCMLLCCVARAKYYYVGSAVNLSYCIL